VRVLKYRKVQKPTKQTHKAFYSLNAAHINIYGVSCL